MNHQTIKTLCWNGQTDCRPTMLPHKLTGPIIVLLPLHVPEALKCLCPSWWARCRWWRSCAAFRRTLAARARGSRSPATTGLPRWCRPAQETTPRVGEGAREGAAAAAAVKHWRRPRYPGGAWAAVVNSWSMTMTRRLAAQAVAAWRCKFSSIPRLLRPINFHSRTGHSRPNIPTHKLRVNSSPITSVQLPTSQINKGF